MLTPPPQQLQQQQRQRQSTLECLCCKRWRYCCLVNRPKQKKNKSERRFKMSRKRNEISDHLQACGALLVDRAWQYAQQRRLCDAAFAERVGRPQLQRVAGQTSLRTSAELGVELAHELRDCHVVANEHGVLVAVGRDAYNEAFNVAAQCGAQCSRTGRCARRRRRRRRRERCSRCSTLGCRGRRRRRRRRRRLGAS